MPRRVERSRSTPPGPWVQHEVRTQFLRISTFDWLRVKTGHKTEYRTARKALAQVTRALTPSPVVAYKVARDGGDRESQLMVLEATWREPLGAIGEESLAAEGYPDMAHFRRYWMERHRSSRFDYLTEVQVYRLRPWRMGDYETLAEHLISRLYAEHLTAEMMLPALRPPSGPRRVRLDLSDAA